MLWRCEQRGRAREDRSLRKGQRREGDQHRSDKVEGPSRWAALTDDHESLRVHLDAFKDEVSPVQSTKDDVDALQAGLLTLKFNLVVARMQRAFLVGSRDVKSGGQVDPSVLGDSTGLVDQVSVPLDTLDVPDGPDNIDCLQTSAGSPVTRASENLKDKREGE